MNALTRWLAVTVLTLSTTAGAAETDIFDRPVPEAHGHPVLVLYTNRTTKEAASAPMTELSVQLRAYEPIVLVRVDLRGVPSLFEGFARRAMKKSYEEGLSRYRQRCKELGIAPPKNDDQGLYFIADSHGKAHQAVGLASGFDEALAVVLDPSGKEILRVPFPRGAADIEPALRRALAKPSEPPAPKQ